MKHNIATLNQMSDSDKIMYVTEKVLKAKSEKTAVTMRQVVDTAIEMGVTEMRLLTIGMPKSQAMSSPVFTSEPA